MRKIFFYFGNAFGGFYCGVSWATWYEKLKKLNWTSILLMTPALALMLFAAVLCGIALVEWLGWQTLVGGAVVLIAGILFWVGMATLS